MRREKLGYEIGKWRRVFKLYPYDTLPVGAYLIFDDTATGLKCYASALIWGKRNGKIFKSKRNSKGVVYIKRVK